MLAECNQCMCGGSLRIHLAWRFERIPPRLSVGWLLEHANGRKNQFGFDVALTKPLPDSRRRVGENRENVQSAGRFFSRLCQRLRGLR